MSSAKILIVEDEGLVAQDIRHRLEQMGYPSPVIASTGEDAVDKASRLSPDLILMDIILSRGYVDGVEAAEKIRAFLDVPIIFLTASSDATTLDRAKLTEPDGYILKPFQTRELQIAIELTLYKYELDREILRQDRLVLATLREMEEGVIATDESKRIFFLNPAAEKLTGWMESDAVGKPVSEIVKIHSLQTAGNEESEHLPAFDSEVRIPSHGNLESKNGLNTEVITVNRSVVPSDREESIGNVLIIRKFGNRK
ncbi:response regulator [Leptospira wolffii]|uniref:Response regulator n=1 Tax=Leptospira wolffii TaxID=409998 RepID=A0ABV5BMC8_9LEPT